MSDSKFVSFMEIIHFGAFSLSPVWAAMGALYLSGGLTLLGLSGHAGNWTSEEKDSNLKIGLGMVGGAAVLMVLLFSLEAGFRKYHVYQGIRNCLFVLLVIAGPILLLVGIGPETVRLPGCAITIGGGFVWIALGISHCILSEWAPFRLAQAIVAAKKLMPLFKREDDACLEDNGVISFADGKYICQWPFFAVHLRDSNTKLNDAERARIRTLQNAVDKARASRQTSQPTSALAASQPTNTSNSSEIERATNSSALSTPQTPPQVLVDGEEPEEFFSAASVSGSPGSSEGLVIEIPSPSRDVLA